MDVILVECIMCGRSGYLRSAERHVVHALTDTACPLPPLDVEHPEASLRLRGHRNRFVR